MTEASSAADRIRIPDFDSVLFDLDGVVYTGPDPVPGAPEAIAQLAAEGIPYAFLTNNAGRAPEEIAAHLAGFGFPCAPEQVVTSGLVAARALAAELPAGAPVLIVGSEALEAAIAGVGLTPVRSAEASPAAVVQGFARTLDWTMLAEACAAIRAGAVWWATNTDLTFPTERGIMPGNGSFVRIIAETTGTRPRVAGKPSPQMMRAGAELLGSAAPIMVGDRLETDIAGARAAGMPAALVLTGVHGPDDARTAAPEMRPDLLLDGLGDLLAGTGRAVP